MSCNLKGLTRKGPITAIATQPKVSHLKVSHLKMSQHLKCLITESVFFLYSWKCLIWKCHNPKNVSSPEMSFCFIPENVFSERVLQLKLSQNWKCFVTGIVSEPEFTSHSCQFISEMSFSWFYITKLPKLTFWNCLTQQNHLIW